MASTKSSPEAVCRIGLISRVDYGSNGFRLGYLELAKEDFAKENINYVIWAGGVISKKEINETTSRLKAAERPLKKQATAAAKALAAAEKQEAPAARLRELRNAHAALVERIEEIHAEISSWDADAIAERYAKMIPQFVNAADEQVKVYIITSKTYDGHLGEEVAQHLADLRSADIRVYKPGKDTFPIKQAGKRLQVLVPTASPWRGKNDSTGVEGLIRDANNIEKDQVAPDLQLVGCYGVTLSKPKGAVGPWGSLPVLHRLQDVRASEHEVGVRVYEISRHRVDPIVRTYSYKDFESNELSYIVLPSGLSGNKRKVAEAIVREGEMSTSTLGEKSGLLREAAATAAEALVHDTKRVLKSWPGLLFYKDSKRWDLDKKWMQTNLRYRRGAEPVTETIVAHGCLHAGSVQTDYRFFIEEVPKVMLATGAAWLVHAGDLIEGLKHNLILRGEVYGGLNCTQQETLAGEMIAKVTIDVFKVRFEAALIDLLSKKKSPSRAEIMACVASALPTNILIPGNHDEWVLEQGHRPLVVIADIASRRITAHIEDTLMTRDLPYGKLLEFVSSRIVVLPNFGSYTLPSGLRVNIQHPHMGNATTASIRLQSSLRMAMAQDCQVCIQANFHTGIHMETWVQRLGQCSGVQLGTSKHASDFETRKMKIVDHGFAHLRVNSVDKRIIGSEIGWYSNEPAKADLLDQNGIFSDLLKKFGLG